MISKPVHEISLTIAGLGVSLICSEPRVISALVYRYRDFPQNSKTHLQLTVEITGDARNHAMLDTGTDFRSGLLHFDAPGYQGWIDEEDGKGQLNLSSKQPVEDIAYFIRVAYALLAFHAGGMMLHAAGIKRDENAYLFFGHSGAGKTTASRASKQCTVLNDDLVILLPESGSWKVSGTPFWNPTQVEPTAESAELHSLYRLVQSPQVSLEEIGASQAIAELISNVPVIPIDPVRSVELLGRLHKILKSKPVYKLNFLPDDSFWRVIPD